MIIYVATNTVNGKQYVGMTTRPLDERIKEHYWDSSKVKGRKLYNAIRKYGWDSFTWEVVDTAETFEELQERERKWIADLDTYEYGYNMTLGGEGGAGCVRTEEQIEHIKKVLQGVNSKLNREEVVLIKKKIMSGELFEDISKEFNVSTGAITSIREERTWSYVEVDGWKEFLQEQDAIREVSLEKAYYIKLDILERKLTFKQIAEKYNVGENAISSINLDICYKTVKVEGWEDRVVDRKDFVLERVRDLDEETVVKIKEDIVVRNYKYKFELAERYDVALHTVCNIYSESAYSSIKVDGWETRKKGNRAIDDDTVYFIKEDLINGLTPKKLAEKYNVKEAAVFDIRRGATYKDIEVQGWEKFLNSRKGVSI